MWVSFLCGPVMQQDTFTLSPSTSVNITSFTDVHPALGCGRNACHKRHASLPSTSPKCAKNSFWLVFRKCPFQFFIRSPVILTDIWAFPQCLQANSWAVPQLGHRCFLPNPFQFISHLIIHATGWALTASSALYTVLCLGWLTIWRLTATLVVVPHR
jgi:hypothetical protein